MDDISEWYQLCVDKSLTKGTETGYYQNVLDAPYPRYKWICLEDGIEERLLLYKNKTVLNYNQTIVGKEPTLPEYMIEDKDWGWAWIIIITYWSTGFFWVFGYIWYFIFALALDLYLMWMLTYGSFVWAFGDLIFYDWILFPLRKLFVQYTIQIISSIVLAIPGFSMIAMPLLGYFSLWDFLDYPDWDGIIYTLYEAPVEVEEEVKDEAM